MSRRYARRHRQTQNAELNITAFMNLMVVLVPFLLITAVFSQVTILEMQLPKESDGQKSKEKPKKSLQLELIILPEAIVVNDRSSGPLHLVKKTAKGYDFDALNSQMYAIKAANPKLKAITILSQEETDYETLVNSMDAVRYWQDSSSSRDEPVNVDLFPAISFGSAPENYKVPRGL